jgi:hypothetical protein
MTVIASAEKVVGRLSYFSGLKQKFVDFVNFAVLARKEHVCKMVSRQTVQALL